MQAPEDDLGKTEGLCGNWLKIPDPVGALVGKDGVKYTDKQTDQFTTSWNNVFNFIRLTPNTSMFDKIHKPDTHLKLEHQYCSCKEKTVDCTKGLGADNPNKKVCAGGKCLTPTFIQNIIRRDIADDYIPENVKASTFGLR
ncbi:hypothetical protein FSP39_008316 [Pinctada imbricata]|uniref:Uncharacterized protein n=1 Tax=Pinctada imbricata TaxID=66713 RepID=A0AA88XTX2_PINIB|nr:hypothetical protein FSP39_008316 [Pinctada imbricata]